MWKRDYNHGLDVEGPFQLYFIPHTLPLQEFWEHRYDNIHNLSWKNVSSSQDNNIQSLIQSKLQNQNLKT